MASFLDIIKNAYNNFWTSKAGDSLVSAQKFLNLETTPQKGHPMQSGPISFGSRLFNIFDSDSPAQKVLDIPSSYVSGVLNNPRLKDPTVPLTDLFGSGISGVKNRLQGKDEEVAFYTVPEKLGIKDPKTAFAVGLGAELLIPGFTELKGIQKADDLIKGVNKLNNLDEIGKTFKNISKFKPEDQTKAVDAVVNRIDEITKNLPFAEKGKAMAVRKQFTDIVNPNIAEKFVSDSSRITDDLDSAIAKQSGEKILPKVEKKLPLQEDIDTLNKDIIKMKNKARGLDADSKQVRSVRDMLYEQDILKTQQEKLLGKTKRGMTNIGDVLKGKIPENIAPNITGNIPPIKPPEPPKNILSDMMERLKPQRILDDLNSAKKAIESTFQLGNQNKIVREFQGIIETKLAPLSTDINKLESKYGKEKIFEMMKNLDDVSNKADKTVLENLKNIFDDIAEFEGLKAEELYQEGYIPRVTEEQVWIGRLKNLFTRPATARLSEIYNPQARRVAEDFIGDASLVDSMKLRINASLDKIVEDANKLNPQKSIIEQIQKKADPEKMVDFDEEVGIFKNKLKGISKELGKKVTTDLEAPFYGWQDISLWDNYIRPIYKGYADIPVWRANMYERYLAGENIINVLANEMGFVQGSTEHAKFIGELSDVLGRIKKKETLDKVVDIVISRTADEVYRNKPLFALEEWIKTHRITDSVTRQFVDTQLKHLLTKEWEEVDSLSETLGYIRRTAQLGAIGGKVSTILLQPLESIRAVARYPKQSMRALFEALDESKVTFSKYKMDTEYDYITKGVGKKELRVPKNKVDKLLSFLEEKGFYGMKKAEDWKNNVFLRSAELKGLDKGLSGARLENYVLDEFLKYSHNYSGMTLPELTKNVFFKNAFMFSTYPIKQMGLLARSIEDITKGGEVSKESWRFLGILSIMAYGQYQLLKNLYKSSMQSYTDVITGGKPAPYNPVVDVYTTTREVLSQEDNVGYDYEKAKENQEKAIARVIPFGNQVYNVTYKGITDIIRGYAETPTDNVKYPAPSKITDIIRTSVLSRYASDEARDYYEAVGAGLSPSLGSNQSDIFRNLQMTQGRSSAEEYYNTKLKQEAQKKYESDKVQKILKKMNDEIVDMENIDTRVQPENIIVRDAVRDASMSELNSKFKELVSAGYDMQSSLQVMQPDFERLGVTAQEFTTYKAKGLDNKDKADYIVNLGENVDWNQLYKDGILTLDVAKKLQVKGFIKDAEALWDKVKLTDPYNMSEYLKKQRKDLVKTVTSVNKDILKTMENLNKEVYKNKSVGNKLRKPTFRKPTSIKKPKSNIRPETKKVQDILSKLKSYKNQRSLV